MQEMGVRTEQVWRLFVLASGQMLVQWIVSDVQGGTRTNFPYLCLHDRDGRAMSSPTRLPWRPGAPVHVDKAGRCYFIRRTSEEAEELVAALMTAQ
jgi:hypothetical protein